MPRHRLPALARALETPLSRRDLLILGSAGAVATIMAASRVQSSQPEDMASLAMVAERMSRPFTIGYWRSGDDADTAVIPAVTLPSGDNAFAGSAAKLKFRGLFPTNDPAIAGSLESLAIDVPYEPFHSEAYRVLSFTNGATPVATSPTSLTVPVDGPTGVVLALTFKTAGMTEASTTLTRLALGDEYGAAKLRSGAYFFGLPDQDGSLPDWKTYQMLPENSAGGCGIGTLACGRDAATARHPYVLMLVE
jgi:hypothetical protein